MPQNALFNSIKQEVVWAEYGGLIAEMLHQQPQQDSNANKMGAFTIA